MEIRARLQGDFSSVVVPEPSPDDRPSTWHRVRMLVTPALVLLLGVVAIAWFNVVVGVILCLVAVATAAAEMAIPMLFKKYVLAPKANIFALIARLTSPGPHRRPQDKPSGLTEDDLIDEAVGFGLTRMAAKGGFFSGGLTESEKESLGKNVLEERAATFRWLSGMPGWEVVNMTAEDGVVLEGRVCRCAPQSGKWVILCHGYAGTWDSMIQYARHWAEEGFNLLLPSMRAHGNSGGSLIGMGLLDSKDVVRWAHFVTSGINLAVPATDVVLMGHSMGGVSVSLASAEDELPDEVKVIVSDCAFESTWGAFLLILRMLGIPVHPVLDLVSLSLSMSRGGYDLACGDVVGAVGRSRVPMMFVHGSADETVPPYMLLRLAEAAGPRCEAMLVPGAGHCQASLADPRMYWDGVLGFTHRYLG